MRPGRLPIRLRLALFAVGTAGVVLVVVGAILLARLRTELDRTLDAALRQRAGEVSALAAGSTQQLAPSLTRRIGGESVAQVLTPAGRIVRASDEASDLRLVTPAELAGASRRPLVITRRRTPAGDLRVRVQKARAAGFLVAVATPLDERDDALATLRAELLLLLPVSILIVAGGSWLLAGAALRPVTTMIAGADAIRRLDHGDRLSIPPTGDELAALATTLNEMLDRIDASTAHERRFVADASHELRTPLTLLGAELEISLRSLPDTKRDRATIGAAADHVQGLSRLVEDLLLIARADEGALAGSWAEIDAGTLAARVARRFSTRASAARRSVLVDACEGPIEIDAERAEQALINLAGNAFQHGRGSVTIVVARDADRVRLAVRDEGAGIPFELEQSAFDRFTRGDPSRGAGGTGLGLAIVALVARLHDGRPYARATARGCEIGIDLPAVAPSDSPRSGPPPARQRSLRNRASSLAPGRRPPAERS